ncbi:MAG: PQQ-binding-like beta-propeller repeat protein [Pseudomonadota bacterium]
MKIFSPILAAILFVGFLSACSTDKKIDDKNAVSVFADEDLIKADDNLANFPISLPTQINNQSWFGSNNDNNQAIENFTFGNQISKTKSIWAGYRPGYNDRMVFAPAIVNDKIYTLDAKGNLYARGATNYKTIWKKKLIERWFVKDFTEGKISYFDGKNAPPSFANANSSPLNREFIFASTGYNLVFCIDAKTGEIIWKKTLSSIPISAPISDGKQVFVITNDNKTYALDLTNGEINWVHSGILKATGILGAANPVSYKNYVISSYSSGEVYALNKKSGEVGWVYDLNISKADNSDFILNDVDATPVIKDGVAYAIGNGGLTMAIRIIDGVILWQKELASITDFWIAGDFIYLITNDNQLISLYKKTGAVKWIVQLKKYPNDKKPVHKIVYNGIIMAGDNLVMTNSNRELLIISPLDGKILQTKNLNQQIFHSPIVVNGKIYLHTIGRFTTNLVVIE